MITQFKVTFLNTDWHRSVIWETKRTKDTFSASLEEKSRWGIRYTKGNLRCLDAARSVEWTRVMLLLCNSQQRQGGKKWQIAPACWLGISETVEKDKIEGLACVTFSLQRDPVLMLHLLPAWENEYKPALTLPGKRFDFSLKSKQCIL